MSTANAREIALGNKCYDCGSTIPNHHTEKCDLAESGAIRDLVSIKNTQWWDKSDERIVVT